MIVEYGFEVEVWCWVVIVEILVYVLGDVVDLGLFFMFDWIV